MCGSAITGAGLAPRRAKGPAKVRAGILGKEGRCVGSFTSAFFARFSHYL